MVTCHSCLHPFSLQPLAWTRCPECHAVYIEGKGGPAVLVIHEAEPIAIRISLILAECGMTPWHATSSKDALQILARGNLPHAVVLDVGLTDIMSFNVIEQIRQSPYGKLSIILVASVFNHTAYKRRPSSLYGADDYVEQHHIHDFLPEKLSAMLQLSTGATKSIAAKSMESETVTEQDTRTDLQGSNRVRVLAHSIVADIALYHQNEINRLARGEAWPNLSGILDEARHMLAEMLRPEPPPPGDPIREAFGAVIANLQGVSA